MEPRGAGEQRGDRQRGTGLQQGLLGGTGGDLAGDKGAEESAGALQLVAVDV